MRKREVGADGARFLDACVCLDVECTRGGSLQQVGVVWRDRSLVLTTRGRDDGWRAELDRFASQGRLLLGHNLLGHDVERLRERAPELRLLRMPVVDTLYLSPLAFPENPYHRLVKDYKLVRETLNDPVADARAARRLFRDEWAAFTRHPALREGLLALFRFCFGDAKLADRGGLDQVWSALGVPRIERSGAQAILRRETSDRACRDGLAELAERSMTPALAYATAWIRVAGSRSVVPRWVRETFPDVSELLRRLRDAPCVDADCAYCRELADPTRQLRRFFGFDAFRAKPAGPDGMGLQERLVRDGMEGGSHLAILPTGGGKSLCYQLPALVRNLRRGTLTIVVSPLQALMKDQVEGLARRTGTGAAAALFGMLTPPERGDVLEKVRMGDTALLYVSPEQLRNRSFERVVASREIGAWVFDEAHCLSKWGHDFRPDYLYAPRFIRELAARQKVPVPPVVCYTATAKPDVRDELLEIFRRELSLELRCFEADVERENLRFSVEPAPPQRKKARLLELVRSTVDTGGSAVVYVATRREASDTARFLLREGLPVGAYHAGLRAPERRDVQERFLRDELRVVCATNAFGMGIDKDDVRLVVHAEIPGSLESYLQEAGRAGRDRQPADCVLLYDRDDIESRFALESLSRLSPRDVSELLRGLRRAARRGEEIVVTAGELLRDEAVETSFGPEERDAPTRVATAIAWLERAGLVERNENRVHVFQGRPRVRSLEEAARKIAALRLPELERALWLAVLGALIDADPSEGLSADDLAGLPAFRHWERGAGDRAEAAATGASANQKVLRVLDAMARAGLVERGLLLTAFLRHGVRNPSREILRAVCALERAMLAALREEAPEADRGEWQLLSLRALNQRLLDGGHESNVETLRRLIGSLAMDGRGLAGQQGSLVFRQESRDRYRVRLQRSWERLEETAALRRELAGLTLETLLARIPASAPPAADQLVEFALEDLVRALRGDLLLHGRVRDPLAAFDRALTFLHEQNAILLQQGLAVFRQAMTLRVPRDTRRRRYTRRDHAPLARHYDEQVFQVHVMDRYARLGLDAMTRAHELTTAYFQLGREAFVRRFFPGDEAALAHATSGESHRHIVEALGSPEQQAIVTAPEEGSLLVLAGPGSGKTRVVVHRCAYLLRVARVRARALLVVCFNRSTALELRSRLCELVGDDARGVAIHTYHGLAARLAGRTFATARDPSETLDFDRLLEEAIALLEGRTTIPGLAAEDQREGLLAGVRHILVDEYQDIDERQYRLVSALAGRTQKEDDTRPSLLAVGDDDQSIYGFRGANVEFIQRFREDYDADVRSLLTNYRSTPDIVRAANELIRLNTDRMKTGREIAFDRRRAGDAGGQHADPQSRTPVQVLEVADEASQAAAAVAELRRIAALTPAVPWSELAVLAWPREVLAPVRALCEHEGIPVRWSAEAPGMPSPSRIRELARFLDGVGRLGAERQLVPFEDLRGLRDALRAELGDSPWWALVDELLTAWSEEAGEDQVVLRDAREFFYESLAERQRGPGIGSGVHLRTVHSAKGLEFDHVLLLDGRWGASRVGRALEEERRLYYVGMTRARRELCLLERRDEANPHTRALRSLEGTAVARRSVARPAVVDPGVLAQRYEVLGMRDLFLDFAGRHAADDPIHERLAALRPGASLCMERHGDFLRLGAADGGPVAALSGMGKDVWSERLERIVRIQVLAMVERRAEDSREEYQSRCRVPRWEVPIIEVVYR